MDDVPEGQVVLRLVDYVTGNELACHSTVVVPRRKEFVRVNGQMHTVFDIEHEFIQAGPRAIHGVTVRLSPCRFQPNIPGDI